MKGLRWGCLTSASRSPGHRAGLFVLTDYSSGLRGWLLGLLAGSAASPRLPHGCQLAEVIRPESPRCDASAFVADDFARRLSGLACHVINERKRRAQQLAGAPRAILGKRRTGFENEVYFGEDILEGLQRCSIRCHASIVLPVTGESKHSLFFRQRTFQALPSQACPTLPPVRLYTG